MQCVAVGGLKEMLYQRNNTEKKNGCKSIVFN